MNILSDALMEILYNFQRISFTYAGNAAGILNYAAYGCRNACSGSCEGSCDGSCEDSCDGGCEGGCESGCRGSFGYD
ncbi:MAG: hypothetical protein IJ667_10730 [Synergistaceae bacterium]|nr:hypothetical protein [Synergistaceae bacterium]